MSVCSLQHSGLSFLQAWATFSVLSLTMLITVAGSTFYYFYAKPTYYWWRYKINPNYPTVEKVQEEIIVMLKGFAASTVWPALSLLFLEKGWGKGYCDAGEHGYGWLFAQILVIWLANDLYQFLYHWSEHRVKGLWSFHRAHHHFYNPTPFSAIADPPVDQFFHAAPIFFFPMIMPIHLDLICTLYSSLFFANTLIQHCGHEFDVIDGHNQWILTSYHHYLHHAKSTWDAPLYNGQFFSLWDKLVGCTYKGACGCSKCARAKGERSKEAWEKVEIPDYSALLQWSSWTKYLSK